MIVFLVHFFAVDEKDEMADAFALPDKVLVFCEKGTKLNSIMFVTLKDESQTQ